MKHRCTLTLLAALLSSPLVAMADDAPESPGATPRQGAAAAPSQQLPQPAPADPDAAEVVEEPTGLFSLEGALTFPTAYVFRGYVYEDQGWIFQPEAYLSFNLPALQDNDVVAITPYVGTWNTIHENKSPDSSQHWFETDIVAGVDFEVAPFTFGLVYYDYIATGDAFTDVQEMGITVSLDDSELGLLPIALNPSVGIYRELDVTRASYLEVGIEPAHTFAIAGREVTIALPVLLGLSVEDYYSDADGDEQTVGFWSTGLTAAIPLEFLNSATGGAWELRLGVTYYYLAAQSAQDTNHDRDDRWVGSVGLGFAF
jgi:hypothetical protein